MSDIPEITDEELFDECSVVQAVALAEKAKFEAEYVKWQAKREELNFQQELAEHEWQHDGIYSFHKQITQKSVDKLLHTLQRWHHNDKNKPWTIYLNSVGGEEFAGWSVIDELRAYSIRGGGTHEIVVKVRGLAGSMGGMILQAGDHRDMGPGSWLMIHKGGGGVHGTVDQMVDEADWLKRSTNRMVDLFMERSTVSRARIMARINRRDWWLTAAEAVEMGFADGIA